MIVADSHRPGAKPDIRQPGGDTGPDSRGAAPDNRSGVGGAPGEIGGVTAPEWGDTEFAVSRAGYCDLEPGLEYRRPGPGIGKWFGLWPGDETDTELLAALDDLD